MISSSIRADKIYLVPSTAVQAMTAATREGSDSVWSRLTVTAMSKCLLGYALVAWGEVAVHNRHIRTFCGRSGSMAPRGQRRTFLVQTVQSIIPSDDSLTHLDHTSVPQSYR